MLARRATVSRRPCRHLLPLDNAEQWNVPPGLTSHPLARGKAVPIGRDAVPSSGNVRHPATARPPRRTHWRLTGCRQVSELLAEQALEAAKSRSTQRVF
jgi:hypothetical protein